MTMLKRFARSAPAGDSAEGIPADAARIGSARLLIGAACLGLALSAITLWLAVWRNEPSATELLWNDLLWYFMPIFSVLNRTLAEGVFPLWNPYQLAGFPFLAAFQTQTLYPPAWAVAWLPPHLAVTAYAVLHWTIAAVGTTWLATELRIRPLAALTAATAYCLSWPVTAAFFFHSASLAVDAWLPLCLATTLRLVAPGAAWSRLAPLAASLTLALLAGAPEHFSYLCFGVVLVGAWHGATTGSVMGIPRALLRVGTALALVAPLAAVQLLPTLELSQHAIRSFGTFEPEYVTRFAQSWSSMLSALVLGHDGPGRLSTFALPLAVIAVSIPGRRREAVGLLVACVLLLDLLRGTEGYVFPLYHEWVPLTRAFRTHLRAEVLFSMSGALLLGLGADTITRASSRRGGATRWLPLLLLLTVAGEALWHGVSARAFVPLQASNMAYGRPELAELADLVRGPSRVFVAYGVPHDGLQHKFGEMHGVYNVAGYDALLPVKYAPFFAIPEGTPWMGRLRFIEREKKVGSTTVHMPSVPLRALDLASVRYYVSAGGTRGDWVNLLVSGVAIHSGSYTVAARDKAMPRAYVVHEASLADTDDAALRAIRDPAFDPTTTVVLRSDSAPALAPSTGGRESVRITRLEANTVEIDTSCATACVLVLTDLDFPGWIAEVDEQPATILNANYLFRALALAPGDHRVAFRYRPRPVAIGALVSALAWLGLAVLNSGRPPKWPFPRARRLRGGDAAEGRSQL